MHREELPHLSPRLSPTRAARSLGSCFPAPASAPQHRPTPPGLPGPGSPGLRALGRDRPGLVPTSQPTQRLQVQLNEKNPRKNIFLSSKINSHFNKCVLPPAPCSILQNYSLLRLDGPDLPQVKKTLVNRKGINTGLITEPLESIIGEATAVIPQVSRSRFAWEQSA